MTNPDNVGGLILRALGCLELLDNRPRPQCRDCADNDGVCPSSGLDCDMRALVVGARRELGKLCRAAPAGGDVPWRCFHCDEVFTTGEAAALHFGTREYQSPACQIDVAAYREMEALQLRYLDEDADVHRAMYRMQSEHQQALRRAEEDGYAKGVRDAEKDSAPAGSGEVDGWLLDGCLIYRLSDGRNQTNTHEINVTMWDGSRELAVRDKAAAALLRKLQQGAE